MARKKRRGHGERLKRDLAVYEAKAWPGTDRIALAVKVEEVEVQMMGRHRIPAAGGGGSLGGLVSCPGWVYYTDRGSFGIYLPILPYVMQVPYLPNPPLGSYPDKMTVPTMYLR